MSSRRVPINIPRPNPGDPITAELFRKYSRAIKKLAEIEAEAQRPKYGITIAGLGTSYPAASTAPTDYWFKWVRLVGRPGGAIPDVVKNRQANGSGRREYAFDYIDKREDTGSNAIPDGIVTIIPTIFQRSAGEETLPVTPYILEGTVLDIKRVNGIYIAHAPMQEWRGFTQAVIPARNGNTPGSGNVRPIAESVGGGINNSSSRNNVVCYSYMLTDIPSNTYVRVSNSAGVPEIVFALCETG